MTLPLGLSIIFLAGLLTGWAVNLMRKGVN